MRIEDYLRNPDIETTLTLLMSRAKVPWRAKVNPEEKECIVFADRMRHLTVQGHYKGIWTHVCNEGKRHVLVALILRAMGLIKGFPDYVFIWPDSDGHRAAFIEFKAPERQRIDKKGKAVKVAQTEQTDYQRLFEKWAVSCGLPYAVCLTTDQALAKLKEWGAIPHTLHFPPMVADGSPPRYSALPRQPSPEDANV